MSALRDGAFTIPAEVLRASGVPAGVTGETAIFAIDFGSEVWLVEAGAGPRLDPDGEGLPLALEREAIDPGRVTRVLLTHLHPDHVGGLSDEDGRPRFPNAEVVLSLRDWGDWLSPQARAAQDEDAAQVAAWAERALSGYPLLRLEDSDLGHGVRSLGAPGHRPGHLAFCLDAAGGGLLFAGDVLHLPDWQIADPDRGLVWDTDAEAARATRRHLLKVAAQQRLLLAGAHLGPWGLAPVEKDGSGFWARPATRHSGRVMGVWMVTRVGCASGSTQASQAAFMAWKSVMSARWTSAESSLDLSVPAAASSSSIRSSTAKVLRSTSRTGSSPAT